MQMHFELSDVEFTSQFENCKLDPTVFNHEAHLRLAWLYIHSYGLEQATVRIQRQLEEFVAHVGAKDKYNKTLTIVAIQVVNHFMEKSNADNFGEFILQFPQLKNDFRALISSHYSFDIFNSIKAKGEFVEPDLSPF